MTAAPDLPDVVFTGIGVTAPTGVSLDDHWSATLAGRSAIRPISKFDASGYPVRLAGEIDETDEERVAERVAKRMMPQTDRMTRLAILAADMALEDAKINPEELPDYSMGVAATSSTGGLEFGQKELEKLWSKGWPTVSAYMSFAWYYAVHTGQISIKNGMRGPGGVVVSEQAGGLDILAFARRRVRRGTAVMTAGGLDGLLCPYGVAIQSAGPDASRSTDPSRAYRPFAAGAAGFVPGEGGAILVMESREEAQRRGAPQIYGRLAGYGATFDPDPRAHGDGLRRAIEVALADAALHPTDIDVVFADAAGSPDLDGAEAAALTTVFGPRGVPVSVPKTMTGRLLSGGAPLDVATALLSLRDGVIPPAINLDPDDVDARLNLVTVARPQPVRTALVLARGHGGFASAAILSGD